MKAINSPSEAKKHQILIVYQIRNKWTAIQIRSVYEPGQFTVNCLPEVVRDEMTEAQEGWKIVKEQKEILSWIYGW